MTRKQVKSPLKPSHSEEEQHFSFRWGIPLLDEGHTEIPNFFFDHYREAGIEREEFLAILHLSRYQFEQQGSVCRPSIPTVARQMGYTPRYLRKILAGLEERGLLLRCFHPGKPTVYDFSGFSRAILKVAMEASDEKKLTPDVEDRSSTPDVQDRGTPELQDRGPRNYRTPEEEQQEEQTRSGEGGGLSDEKALALLIGFGISAPVARSLAAACAVEQIEGWIRYAENAKGLKDGPALVVARLRAGEQSPKAKVKRVQESTEDRRQRYAGGEFGKFIEC